MKNQSWVITKGPEAFQLFVSFYQETPVSFQYGGDAGGGILQIFITALEHTDENRKYKIKGYGSDGVNGEPLFFVGQYTVIDRIGHFEVSHSHSDN